MARKTHIKKFTAEELNGKIKRGESRSDWAKAEALTHDEIESAVLSDPDDEGLDVDWNQVTVDLPHPKEVLNMRIDKDVLDFFRKSGRGYQTRINAILRGYVDQKRKQA